MVNSTGLGASLVDKGITITLFALAMNDIDVTDKREVMDHTIKNLRNLASKIEDDAIRAEYNERLGVYEKMLMLASVVTSS